MGQKREKIMLGIIGILVASNICVVGYSVNHLKTENKALRQDLESTKETVKENEDLYFKRNELDSSLRYILEDATAGNYSEIKNNFTNDITISNHTIKGANFEFLIPENTMNLRQRSYFKRSANEYVSIYEIYDSGYTNSKKYTDRIYSLNLKYVFVDNDWKINSIFIDE